MLRTSLVISLFCSLHLVEPAWVWAQSQGPEKSPRKAYLEPEEADEDFAMQGEFFGGLDAASSTSTYGVQIIASGNGDFGGVLYPGGLPGNGWDRQQRIRFTGQRLADSPTPLAELTSEDGQKLRVTAQGVDVISSEGDSRGVLPRVKRSSPTLGLPAPPTAVVLFDGEPRLLEAAKVERDLLAMGCRTEFNVGDFRLHLEFRTPYMPAARGQSRGNSGVYIQQRYEVQILDSFGLDGAANECGGLYRQTPPEVNLCLPPLSWQTYDIYFRAPRWDGQGENKTENARITVLHNGFPIHFDREVKTKTGAGKPETPDLFPILFQNHGDPVRYRNLWIQFPPADGAPPGMLAPLDRGVFDF